MFSRIDIEKRLTSRRDKRIDEQVIMEEVNRIFSENEKHREKILSSLTAENSFAENKFNFEFLETSRIFHEDDIKEICAIYRLRFLDSNYFKGKIPEEAISKIRILENLHQTHLGNFKIVAPAKLLKLENADDPLLFAPMGNGYYYLIHKWGRDLHPFRKMMMWPFRSMENLATTVVIFCILLTAISPMHWFTPTAGIGNYIFLFMIILNSVGGLVLLYGISKGKNFNGVVWNSKYYNG